MKFTLTRRNLDILKNKIKLYNHISSLFTRAYFKVDSNNFTFMLRGQTGVFQTTMTLDIPLDPSEDSFYFSIDYSKWQIALQKFENTEALNLETTSNLLKISSKDSNDLINLGLLTFKEDSSEAVVINNFIASKKAEASSFNKLTITPTLLNSLNFVDTLFSNQSSQVNSIGLNKKNIIYSDRATVLKINLTSDAFLENLIIPNNEEYIFIHSNTIKLFNLLFKTSGVMYFTDTYDDLYWEDEDSSLYMILEERKVALPTQEEFESIKPQDAGQFEISLGSIKNGLDFFTGFYEGSMWKPITFEIFPNKEISLHYKHPIAEITKTLNNVVGSKESIFTIDSETLRKILNRASENTGSVIFSYDEDAPGIYILMGNCEAVLSKLEE